MPGWLLWVAGRLLHLTAAGDGGGEEGAEEGGGGRGAVLSTQTLQVYVRTVYIIIIM